MGDDAGVALMDKFINLLLTSLVSVFLFTTTVQASTAAKATILVVGDSLSAAYNMPQEAGWVRLLEQRLNTHNPSYSVINASISGDTTAGGVSRIGNALRRSQPALTIIELGANDGLRGLPLTEMKKNLAQMIELAKIHGSKVLLLGINLPPNYGPHYTSSFVSTYHELADQHHIALVPSMMEGFEADPAYFQADQIHPSIAAQSKILDNVWPSIELLLDSH